MIRIISLPRSGSTILQRLICTNKSIPFIQETWLDLRIFGVLASEDGKLPFGYSSTKRFSDAFIGQNKELLYRELLNAQDRFLKTLGYDPKLYLDKTPNNYLILSQIYRQEDKYILLLRDKKEVLMSYLFEMRWSVFKWWKYVYDIENFNSLVDPFKEKENVLVVEYENILHNIDDERIRISKFLGIRLSNELSKLKFDHHVGDSRAFHSSQISIQKHSWLRQLVRNTFAELVFTRVGLSFVRRIYRVVAMLQRTSKVVH